MEEDDPMEEEEQEPMRGPPVQQEQMPKSFMPNVEVVSHQETQL